ncbi:Parp14 [Symbiodinium natans]|uniref:Poly [ADP-ribose] polymerase n=1 Tax=Symbiodinium natans TaxID=878477 RepID=A0A812UI29_9DINO|nr:Parp14 [Symbiodinium natans]
MSAECKDSESSVHLQFSDGRFLRQVLLEAQRNGSDPTSVSKLEGMGFGPEIAKVALHVSGGDESKALQLCMSGLSFVDPEASLEACAPPAPLRCYICGQKYLTHKSLDMHLRACKRRFELQESKRPSQERCQLLEEWELPAGVDCLQRHCENVRSLGLPQTIATTFEDWVETRQPTVDPSKLLPCQFCKRTFLPNRLETHQKVCLQRPKQEPKRPVRRQTMPARPPPAATSSFNAFCNQLQRCTVCQRQFKPEVLAAHQKRCTSQVQAVPVPIPIRRTATSPPRRTAERRSRSQSQSLSFTPPSRRSTGTPGNTSKSSNTPSFRLKWPEGSLGSPGASLPLSLLDSGLISRVADEANEARICEKLGDLKPRLVGVYAATLVQQNVYDALKATMMRDGLPEERELWHGTSWSFVPKIFKQGFNRSFAGRHGTLLGHATYFSSDPRYSLRFCDKGGGEHGTKALILSRVLVGHYCKGSPGDVEPPVRNDDGDRYDTTVDSGESPSIFAVFRDFQAVPLFLVEISCEQSCS